MFNQDLTFTQVVRSEKRSGFPAVREAANLANEVIPISSNDAHLIGVLTSSVGTGFSVDNETPKTHNGKQ